jgi:hypothetical protein
VPKKYWAIFSLPNMDALKRMHILSSTFLSIAWLQNGNGIETLGERPITGRKAPVA